MVQALNKPLSIGITGSRRADFMLEDEPDTCLRGFVVGGDGKERFVMIWYGKESALPGIARRREP